MQYKLTLVRDITVSHGSAYTVVRATQQVQYKYKYKIKTYNAPYVTRVIRRRGEWQFWGYPNSVTPEPIDYKFDTPDFVDELTSYAKFHKIRRHKG